MPFIERFQLDTGFQEPRRGIQRPESRRASSAHVSEDELRDALSEVLAASEGSQHARAIAAKQKHIQSKRPSGFSDNRYKRANSSHSPEFIYKERARYSHSKHLGANRKPDRVSIDPTGHENVQGSNPRRPTGESRDWRWCMWIQISTQCSSY